MKALFFWFQFLSWNFELIDSGLNCWGLNKGALLPFSWKISTLKKNVRKTLVPYILSHKKETASGRCGLKKKKKKLWPVLGWHEKLKEILDCLIYIKANRCRRLIIYIDRRKKDPRVRRGCRAYIYLCIRKSKKELRVRTPYNAQRGRETMPRRAFKKRACACQCSSSTR